MRLLRLTPALAALAIAATPVHAQNVVTPAGTMVGIEAMMATVMQEQQSSFSGLALRVRLQPPQLLQQIEIMPTIEYWRNSNHIATYDVSTERKDATLGIDMRYNFEAGTFRPYLGAGWALHFLSSEVDAPTLGLPESTNSIAKGGFAALAGVSFPITEKFENFLDFKYHHVTDYRQLKMNWGFTYKP
jgi:Outer membrane protein beta-barrel domain